ncbi:MAG: hypothetical protein GC131_05405 [Alphaproteobacteria bacterium]|nr:hypothetical protein [Alphaproteobacteria bacterium]
MTDSQPSDESKARQRTFMEDRARRGSDRKQRWKLMWVLVAVAAFVIVAYILYLTGLNLPFTLI